MRLRRQCLFLCKASLLYILLLMAFLGADAKKRNDVIVMKNGDRLTGDVKKLENGVLYVDTEYFSGSVGLDWLQIDRLESSRDFQVILKDGKRIAGRIRKISNRPENKDFVIHTDGGDHWASSADVVEMRTQKESFWRQLTGSTSLGYSYTSGNRQTALNASANANYTTTRWFAGASANTSFSGQTGSEDTTLVEIQNFNGIYLNDNSFLMTFADFFHSTQQDLALRTTLGGGYGRYLLHTNRQMLISLAGAVFAHESFESTNSSTKNAEALVGLQYQLFRFDRYGLQTQFLAFPGLTDAPRIRTTSKLTVGVKLTNKFRNEFQVWNYFDSAPPVNAKHNETGVSNTLGWTF